MKKVIKYSVIAAVVTTICCLSLSYLMKDIVVEFDEVL